MLERETAFGKINNKEFLLAIQTCENTLLSTPGISIITYQIHAGDRSAIYVACFCLQEI
jgi:hypothetical protein